MLDCQPNKEKEAPDSSFALVKALQCYIFFLRIKLHPFQMLFYLLHGSYYYTNAMTIRHCCS